jgi:hypothetical protein
LALKSPVTAVEQSRPHKTPFSRFVPKPFRDVRLSVHIDMVSPKTMRTELLSARLLKRLDGFGRHACSEGPTTIFAVDKNLDQANFVLPSICSANILERHRRSLPATLDVSSGELVSLIRNRKLYLVRPAFVPSISSLL